MNITGKSLRLRVEKWLKPTDSKPAQVTEFSRMYPNQRSYVRADGLSPANSVGIFFFLYDDGTRREILLEAGTLAMAMRAF